MLTSDEESYCVNVTEMPYDQTLNRRRRRSGSAEGRNAGKGTYNHQLTAQRTTLGAAHVVELKHMRSICRPFPLSFQPLLNQRPSSKCSKVPRRCQRQIRSGCCDYRSNSRLLARATGCRVSTAIVRTLRVISVDKHVGMNVSAAALHGST